MHENFVSIRENRKRIKEIGFFFNLTSAIQQRDSVILNKTLILIITVVLQYIKCTILYIIKKYRFKF